MDIRKGEGTWTDLCEIADGPGPYTMSYGFNLDLLCESIRKVGLINPPLLARNQEGSFDVVSGYRRILALKALGKRKVFCLDVTVVLPSTLKRFLAAFYENLATRKFNDMEKALILNKLQSHVRKKEILASFMPLLSLPSHEGTLEFFLKLLDLDGEVQKALASEEISIKVAKFFVAMEKTSCRAVFKWISTLKFNFNQQVKFIDYLEDIRVREDVTIGALLCEEYFIAILENPHLNNPQKVKAVLEALRARRFPRLVQRQKAIESVVSAIAMPPEACVHYDPYLEDPDYQLEIKFRHGKDLKSAIRKLHALRELEAIPELWAGK